MHHLRYDRVRWLHLGRDTVRPHAWAKVVPSRRACGPYRAAREHTGQRSNRVRVQVERRTGRRGALTSGQRGLVNAPPRAGTVVPCDGRNGRGGKWKWPGAIAHEQARWMQRPPDGDTWCSTTRSLWIRTSDEARCGISAWTSPSTGSSNEKPKAEETWLGSSRTRVGPL